MKISYIALVILSIVSYTEAQFDAKKCLNYLDCPSTLCCGTATPQIARYGSVHKICYRPNKNLYMNYNGYKFDFACDPIITDEPEKPEDKGSDSSGGLTDYNADRAKYEGRFWDNYKGTDTENIPGYGVAKPWKAPIGSPDSLITIYDRWMLTSHLMYNPIVMGCIAWLEGFGEGDSWDGFFYNNAIAAGSQLYPTGLSKYFDLHSIDGLTAYTFHWIWDYIQHLCLPLTLFVPVDVWMALFNGTSLKGLWKIFVFYEPFVLAMGYMPSLVASFFKIEMQDGWGIMYN